MAIEFEQRTSIFVTRAGPYRVGQSFPVKPLSVGEQVTLTVKSAARKQVHAIIRAIEGEMVTVEVTRRLIGETHRDTLIPVGETIRVRERQITGAGLASDAEQRAS